MTIKLYNIQHNGTVHTPLFIAHGEATSSDSGIITVSHQGNAFPPLYYEVNSKFFKAVVHLEPGENQLLLTHSAGQVVNGFPQYSNNGFKPFIVALTINYVPLVQNKPVHLCLLLARDSPALYDTTSVKNKQEGNGLDLAVKKLRIGGRLMQAFTNEQMLRAGFGNRTFNFAEEYTRDTQFLQESDSNTFRNTIKIHILRSKKTVAELRDPNLAQQNSKGTNTGGLFGIAMDALTDYGGPFAPSNHPVQAAVMFIDTHWDKKLNLILTHAALGGGDGRYKLAIFGSHGIYSWPTTLEQVVPAFQDTTRSDINEVANDCNQCGSYWECLNITLGAFMHEIGHLLGCPHQTHGVMLRDYVTFNRSFLTRETACLRTNSRGFSPVMPKDECTWHRLDLLRFLYHPSFVLPSDYLDSSFQKSQPHSKPVLLPLGDGRALLKGSGIYAIEIYKGDLAHAYIEYLPKSIGGEGPQSEILVDAEQLRSRLPADKQQGDFSIHVLAIGGNQAEFPDFVKFVSNSENVIHSDFGLGRGQLVGLKSGLLGDSNRGTKQPLAIFDPTRVVNVRVYWGGALDGVRIDLGNYSNSNSNSNPPPIPQRDYKSSFSSLIKNFKGAAIGNNDQNYRHAVAISGNVLFGKATNNYTDFPLNPGEIIDHFKLRSGGWVDAIQIVTSSGRVSPMFGKNDGGGEGTLAVPEGYEIIGFHGSVGQWIDSIGVVYVPK